MGTAPASVKDGPGRGKADPALAQAAGERLGSGYHLLPDAAAQFPAPRWRPVAPMVVLFELVWQVIEIYKWVVIIAAITTWLVAFNVINMRNQFVYSLTTMLYRLTEPALRPIKRIVPNLGGVDISPVILLLLLWFIQRLIERYILLPAALQGI